MSGDRFFIGHFSIFKKMNSFQHLPSAGLPRKKPEVGVGGPGRAPGDSTREGEGGGDSRARSARMRARHHNPYGLRIALEDGQGESAGRLPPIWVSLMVQSARGCPGGGAAQEGPHCKPLAANTPASGSGPQAAHPVQPLPLAKLFGHREGDLFDTVTGPPTAALGSGHRRLPSWLLDLDVSPTGFTTENPDWLDFFAMVFSQINGE